jgi:hypothetical protein
LWAGADYTVSKIFLRIWTNSFAGDESPTSKPDRSETSSLAFKENPKVTVDKDCQSHDSSCSTRVRKCSLAISSGVFKHQYEEKNEKREKKKKMRLVLTPSPYISAGEP